MGRGVRLGSPRGVLARDRRRSSRCVPDPDDRLIGLIMGFGAGVLISAVAFDISSTQARRQVDSGEAVIAGLLGGLRRRFFGG